MTRWLPIVGGAMIAIGLDLSLWREILIVAGVGIITEGVMA